ncbi:MAG TPA: enoyl-CoA hydratase-related protein [Candidatus Limnocylindria bacterium]|nr:enoyl-CoA hydratase-related protein [Candidatus Limnocylindria bacterium]
MTGPLRVERLGPVARVVLDRPEVRNAFNADLIIALTDAFATLADEPAEALRAVVVAGDGPVFCAGADVEWLRAAGTMDLDANEAEAGRLATMLETIDTCPVPVVARVHGAALGGGMGLCAVSDIVIAAADATFGFTETRLGILPAVIGPYAIAKIGEGQARALFLPGRRFDAAQAEHIGLVHEVVADETALDERVAATVEDLLAAGPHAAREAKALIRRLRGQPGPQARALTIAAIARQRTSPEGQEGLTAFLEKRDPSWRARPD